MDSGGRNGNQVEGEEVMKSNYRVYLNAISEKTFLGSFMSRTAESIADDVIADSFYILPDSENSFWQTVVVVK